MAKTIFIGLGGLGGKVLLRIKQQRAAMANSASKDFFAVIDRDEYDWEEFSDNGIHFTVLAPSWKIKDCITILGQEQTERWFPVVPAFLEHVVGNADSSRACGRLAFSFLIETGGLDALKHMLDGFLAAGSREENVRVVIVTSLAGGTGSGIFIQMALWIRRYLQNYSRLCYSVSGFFAGPEVFISSFRDVQDYSCDYLRANAHASLLELKEINSLKTGSVRSSPVEVCYDDLLKPLDRQNTQRIFDQLCIYEPCPVDGDRILFDDHILRMARNISLLFGHHFPIDQFAAPCYGDPNGMNLVDLGSAVAEYSKNEVLRYCALRAALNLTQYQAREMSGVDRKEQADAFVDTVLRLIHEAIRDRGYFGERLCDPFSIEPREDILQYVYSTIQHIGDVAERSSGEVPALGSTVLDQIVPRSFEGIYRKNNPVYSLFTRKGEDGSVVHLPLNVVQDTIRYIIAALNECMKEAGKTEEPDFFTASSVPAWPGKRDLEPSQGVEFPVLVWQKNKARRALFGERFQQEYLEWFAVYCEQITKQYRQQMTDKMICWLFPKLIDILNGLSESLNGFVTKLNEGFERAFEDYINTDSTADTIKLCATPAIKDSIFRKVLPYENISKINQSYAYCSLAQFCYTQWPGCNIDLCRNKDFLGSAFRDIVGYIEASIRESSIQHVDFDAIEALFYQELGNTRPNCPMNLDGEAREKLTGLLMYLAVIADRNLSFTGGGETGANGYSYTWFGVHKASAYHYDAYDIIDKMTQASTVGSNLDRSVIWCLKVTKGIAFDQCPIMTAERYRDAYQRICNRGKKRGYAPWTPHMDKRWFELMNGES